MSSKCFAKLDFSSGDMSAEDKELEIINMQIKIKSYLGGHSTIPQTGWLKQQKFFFEFLNFILFIFYTADSYQLSILYILVYICQSQSPNSSHQHHPPRQFPPLVSIRLFLHLCLYFCTANQFICTIFLSSTYMR